MIWSDAAVDSSVAQVSPPEFCDDIREQLQYTIGGFAGFTDDFLVLYQEFAPNDAGKLTWGSRWQVPIVLVRAVYPLTLSGRNIWPALARKRGR